MDFRDSRVILSVAPAFALRSVCSPSLLRHGPLVARGECGVGSGGKSFFEYTLNLRGDVVAVGGNAGDIDEVSMRVTLSPKHRIYNDPGLETLLFEDEEDETLLDKQVRNYFKRNGRVFGLWLSTQTVTDVGSESTVWSRSVGRECGGCSLALELEGVDKGKDMFAESWVYTGEFLSPWEPPTPAREVWTFCETDPFAPLVDFVATYGEFQASFKVTRTSG